MSSRPRTSALRHTVRPGTRAFTLIELMVVVAIIAGIMAMSVRSIASLRNAQLRAGPMRVSGALRMVYGRSAVNALRYQVTFNLDDDSLSVQCSDENVLLEEAPAEDAPARSDDRELDPFGLGASPPTLDDCSEPLLSGLRLRNGIEIARVLTIADKEPVESGSVTVAYFPNGFVERTMVWIRDGESYLTLSVDPMSGRVRIAPGDVEPPRDFHEVEED